MNIMHPCASISIYLAQVHSAAGRQMVWETETRKWQSRWKTKFGRKGEIRPLWSTQIRVYWP